MKIIILIFTTLLFVSCGNGNRKVRDINCEYKGGIIYGVHNFGPEDFYYDIKYQGEIIELVVPYKIDRNYKEGDTIKKSCIQ